jgi:phosphatidylglycerol lysyltransferase
VNKEQMIERARGLILRHGWNATAYQILNPGIERWFTAAADGLVGYVECGGYRVVAGAPVCAPERLPEVVEEFEDDTHGQGLWTCYFAADERLAKVLAARGPWDRILLGAQPVWQPSHWQEILRRKASLRAQLNRARNKGVVVRLGSPELNQKQRAELLQCLEEWLATRGLPPLHFLVEPETLDRLYDRKVYVAELCGKVVAFLVASPIPERRGWLVEQTIRGQEAPNGSCELLLDIAMRDLAENGAEYLTLGLSPLSRRAGLAGPQRLWLKLMLAWTRAHGRRFYNFDGLDAYKAKFMPESWEPIYAITSERRVGLGTLYAIAGAFGKMSPVSLVIRALGRAMRRELGWLRRRWSS